MQVEIKCSTILLTKNELERADAIYFLLQPRVDSLTEVYVRGRQGWPITPFCICRECNPSGDPGRAPVTGVTVKHLYAMDHDIRRCVETFGELKRQVDQFFGAGAVNRLFEAHPLLRHSMKYTQISLLQLEGLLVTIPNEHLKDVVLKLQESCDLLSPYALGGVAL